MGAEDSKYLTDGIFTKSNVKVIIYRQVNMENTQSQTAWLRNIITRPVAECKSDGEGGTGWGGWKGTINGKESIEEQFIF